MISRELEQPRGTTCLDTVGAVPSMPENLALDPMLYRRLDFAKYLHTLREDDELSLVHVQGSLRTV